MNIRSAEFIKGLVNDDQILDDEIPHVAFIGRSNVGKSSMINTLTKQKSLARTSPTPGHTREINLFLINKSLYLADLPGYGFSRGSDHERNRLRKLIDWYLFKSPHQPRKVFLLVDASIDPTATDLEMLQYLEEGEKNIIIVANKVDKIKNSEYKKQLQKIHHHMGPHKIIPYSSQKRIGTQEVIKEIFE